MDEIFPKGAAWIDGQFVKLSDAKIKVTFDVSTALGAGIADTNKCYMLSIIVIGFYTYYVIILLYIFS